MPTLYEIIRRPLITEKGLQVKETESTLVFDVAPRGDQDGSETGRRSTVSR